jgi:uncharacterized protein YjbJ (UPF0337 family)
MDENRIAGTARSFGGKAEEGVARVMGDAKTQVRGMADQAAGAAQDLYGQARDTAADAAVAARDSAASLEKWLRRTIETQPFTAAIVAMGLGWLLGRIIGLCSSSARTNRSRCLIRRGGAFRHVSSLDVTGCRRRGKT